MRAEKKESGGNAEPAELSEAELRDFSEERVWSSLERERGRGEGKYTA